VERLAEQRSSEIKAEWPGLHKRLLKAAKAIESD